MALQKNNEDKGHIFWIIGIAILIILCWWFSGVFIDNYVSSCGDAEAKRGQFGDKFGFINALFSGLALAAVAYSIWLQRKELSLQRQELSDTREVFQKQAFENTFYNLIKNQHEIINSIDTSITYIDDVITKTHLKNVRGRELFISSKKEIIRIYTALKSKEHSFYDSEHYHALDLHIDSTEEYKDVLHEAQIDYTFTYYNITKEKFNEVHGYIDRIKLKLAYGYFYNKYHFAIGHYFRHLYHILLFIEKNENEALLLCKDNQIEINKVAKNFKGYAQFLQAQLSSPELFLLYYNCLHYPKTLQLVKKYDVLSNLAIEDLINQNHIQTDITISKRRTDLLNFRID